MKRGSLCLWVSMLLTLVFITPAMANVTIRLASWGTHDDVVAAAQEAVAKYGITIEYTRLPPAQYVNKVIVEALAGIGADVVAELPYRYNLYDAGILADLTPFLTSDPELNFDSFHPSVRDMYTYFGGTWILPAVISPYVLFYNKDHFGEAGMATPEEHWRWDTEVADAMKKLRQVQEDGRVTRYGLLMENRLLTPVFSNGGDILSADGTRSLIAAQPVVDMLLLLQEWRNQDLIPDLKNHRPTFASGQGSMHAVMGTFSFGSYVNSDQDWGISYVPLGASGRSIEENTWGYGISAHTEHPEEAWIVAKALAMVPGSVLVPDGQLSPIIGQTDAETLGEFQRVYDLPWDEMMIALESIQNVRPSFRHKNGARIQSIVTSAFGDVVRNGKSPGSVLPAAAEQIEALLD